MVSTTPLPYGQGYYGGDDPFSQACARCGGLTVPELMRDGVVVSVGRRCVICGDIVDAVILRNRGYSPTPV